MRYGSSFDRFVEEESERVDEYFSGAHYDPLEEVFKNKGGRPKGTVENDRSKALKWFLKSMNFLSEAMGRLHGKRSKN